MMRDWIRRGLVAASLLVAFACGGEADSTQDAGAVRDTITGADIPGSASADGVTHGIGDAADDDDAPVGGADSSADDVATPAPYTRPERGEPVDQATLDELTELYLDLLAQTRYFAVTEARVHGWPRSDPEGRYWYGTWWSGVHIVREDGAVSFVHPEDGSDNNGMRTAPILAAACFAHALWGNEAPLVRELVRGFTSWSLAMDRPGHDTGPLLARAAYPEPVVSTDDGVAVLIDYSLDRPGVDNRETDPHPPSLYVHNPDNPHWGDIWIKNKRSKDDIGHILQTLAYLPACTADADEGLRDDMALLTERYTAWCRRVEQDDWQIATVDPDWEVTIPPDDLAHFILMGNVECTSALALRLYGRGDSGSIDCGDGLSLLDEAWEVKNDFHQIRRSFHEAAIALALMRGEPELARALLDGLAWRLDKIFDAREAAEAPDGPAYDGPHDQDLAELVAMSAAAGLPLNWREVRFLHDRIREAHDSYLTEQNRALYDVLAPDAPDGSYAFTPSGAGLFWRLLGAPLGSCASPYVNPSSKPILDCDLVRAAGDASR